MWHLERKETSIGVSLNGKVVGKYLEEWTPALINTIYRLVFGFDGY